MDAQEFLDYVIHNFNISGSCYRMISNILYYVKDHIVSEEEQYFALSYLLEGTIGLSDREIRMISL